MKENIFINTLDARVCFTFADTGLCLDLSGNNESKGYVQAWVKNNTDAQKWVTKREKGSLDTYYILIGSKSALTYDEASNGICLEELTYSDNQKWIIQ